jgi:NitT/TauT family transport system substrate-binding protein
MRIWLTLLLALLVLAGCGEPPPAALRVGVSPWVGYDPLVLARDNRLLDAERVRVIELGSSTECARALSNGTLDAAALSLDEALRLADEGAALKIVAVLDVSRAAAAIVAGSGITSAAQLRGKRIALEQTALGTLVLDRLLQAGGLQTSDVTLIQVEVTHHEAVLTDGRADVVITFEPIRSRLLAHGHSEILPSRPGQIDDVLVVSQRSWLAQRAQLRELLAGWEGSRRVLADDPQSVAALLAPATDLTPAQYLSALTGVSLQSLADSVRWLEGEPAPLAEHAAPLVHSLLRLGLIRSSPNWPVLLDGKLASETHAIMAGRRK